MSLQQVCFRLKKEGILQKIGGPTEIILRFFLRFSGFLRFFQLQAVVFQRQPPIRPLPKKSYLKTDGRFSFRSGMCHNRRMTVEMTGRNEGCEGWTAIKRQPAFAAKRFGARNDSSAFGHSAGIIGRISDHGFHGFHGSKTCRFLSVQSVQSVVAFLWLRLAALSPRGLSGLCSMHSSAARIQIRAIRPSVAHSQPPPKTKNQTKSE